MTTITHTLLGVATGVGACTLFPSVFDCGYSTTSWILVFVGLSNLPDIDLLLLLVPKRIRGESRLWNHRGITHGFVAMILFAALCVTLLGVPIGCEKWWQMFLVFVLAIGLHLFCDSIDGSSGICLAAPFWSRLFSSGYCLNDDLPLDVLSTGKGRAAFLYGVAVETLCVTLPVVLILFLVAKRA